MDDHREIKITIAQNGWVIDYKDQNTFVWLQVVFLELKDVIAYVEDYIK